MPKMIFVNLPVSDLDRSIAFYEAIGARKEPKFSDATAAMMIFSDAIAVMLLTHDKFRQFTPKQIPDTRSTAQMLLCLSTDSRDQVDDLIARAGAAGGRPDTGPVQDFGLMYCRSFDDPDGHGFEIAWMDAAAAEQGASAFEGAAA